MEAKNTWLEGWKLARAMGWKKGREKERDRRRCDRRRGIGGSRVVGKGWKERDRKREVRRRGGMEGNGYEGKERVKEKKVGIKVREIEGAGRG